MTARYLTVTEQLQLVVISLAITYLRMVRGTQSVLERYGLAQIVIIDDDPLVGDILARLLKTKGHGRPGRCQPDQ